jgi:PAS domain S-box-containing protein
MANDDSDRRRELRGATPRFPRFHQGAPDSLGISVQAAQLALLAATAQALARNAGASAALAEVLAACLDVVGVSRAAFYLADARDRVILREQIGFPPGDRDQVDACFGQPWLLRQALDDDNVIEVPSPAVTPNVADRLLLLMGVSSAMIVPVVWSVEVRGALVLGTDGADAEIADAMARARGLRAQIAHALGLAQTFTRLALAEQRYRTLMEGARDPVSVLTPAGIILEVNHRWEELLQVPRERIVGRSIEDFTVPASDKLSRLARGGAGDGASPWTRLLRVRRPGGSEALLETSNVALEVGGEHVVFAISRDVTELTRDQERLMMSDRLASVGMLAAGVAHEINNPLAAVMANLELAALDLAKLPKLPKQDAVHHNLQAELADAREAAERVRQIALDLKIFSRPEQDVGGSVDIRGILKSSLRMAAGEIRHRAKLVANLDEVPAVKGSASRFGQAFLTLILNAAQAIPEGNAENNEIRVRVSTNGRHVVIEVSDTGPAVPPEALRQLFTPFFMSKPTGVGTGLGMSICQRIVESAGGQISVESRAGAGTTFQVRLPVLESKAGAPTHGARFPKTAAPRRGHLLIIDDEPTVIRVIERTLASQHDITSTSSAAHALARIAAGDRFDVILCDLMMPQMTGIDLHNELRKVASDQAERMIFLTGGAFTPRGRAFLDDVPNPRVDKPFDPRALLALVNRHLG